MHYITAGYLRWMLAPVTAQMMCLFSYAGQEFEGKALQISGDRESDIDEYRFKIERNVRDLRFPRRLRCQLCSRVLTPCSVVGDRQNFGGTCRPENVSDFCETSVKLARLHGTTTQKTSINIRCRTLELLSFWTLSIVQFRKLDLCPSAGMKLGTPTVLVRTKGCKCPQSRTWRRKQIQLPKRSVFQILDDGQIPKMQ
jgi:hypothetical protein